MMVVSVISTSGHALSFQKNGSLDARRVRSVGLADSRTEPSARIRHNDVFTSPDAEASRQSIVDHPHNAKTSAPYNPYLPRWHERAIIAAEAVAAASPWLQLPSRGTA